MDEDQAYRAMDLLVTVSRPPAFHPRGPAGRLPKLATRRPGIAVL